MTSREPKEISLAEAAVRLKESPLATFHLVTAGKLEGRKQGKQWVVTVASIDAHQRRLAKGD